MYYSKSALFIISNTFLRYLTKLRITSEMSYLFKCSLSQEMTFDTWQGLMRIIISLFNETQLFSLWLVQPRFHTERQKNKFWKQMVRQTVHVQTCLSICEFWWYITPTGHHWFYTLCRSPDKRRHWGLFKDNFSYFSIKAYVMTPHSGFVQK